MISRRKKVGRSRRRGAAIVEAAMVLPICLIFLFGIMEYGRYLMIMQVVTNAAREGCRYAQMHVEPVTIQGVTSGNSLADVSSAATSALAGLKLDGQKMDVYLSDSYGARRGVWTDARRSDYVCVRITGSYKTVVGGLLGLPKLIPIQARSVMRCESN